MSPIQPLVIIPPYDERDNIESLIDAVRRVLPAAHLLIVDDNSHDGTAAGADVHSGDPPFLTERGGQREETHGLAGGRVDAERLWQRQL